MPRISTNLAYSLGKPLWLSKPWSIGTSLTQRYRNLSVAGATETQPGCLVLPRTRMASRGEILLRQSFRPTIFVPGKLGFAQWLRSRKNRDGQETITPPPGLCSPAAAATPPLPPVSSRRLALGCVPDWLGVVVREGNPKPGRRRGRKGRSAERDGWGWRESSGVTVVRGEAWRKCFLRGGPVGCSSW